MTPLVMAIFRVISNYAILVAHQNYHSKYWLLVLILYKFSIIEIYGFSLLPWKWKTHNSHLKWPNLPNWSKFSHETV